MDPLHWSRVRELLDAAVALPEAERPAFLEQAAGGDGELRGEVESLLAAAARVGEFLETPAAAELTVPTSLLPEPTHLRIARWEVLREIGRGGMGAVYLAQRREGDFSQLVAIKVVRRGMDEFSVRRFAQERQILAGLAHPNIARLYDGGTTEDGLPYFAMEYVEGLPITESCQARGLDVVARLRLFQAVCEAVEYAHHRLVIHRDIKPANILVTAEGVPKLLDFGIAKLLDSAAEGPGATVTLALAMTPEYASPEQVRGEPVTTATDVYGLGLLLFELLTEGRAQPMTAGSIGEAMQIVCEREAPRPSTVAPRRVRRRLAGDLDAIVAKALRKEPGRRYGSAQELGDDVARHLGGEPVQARGDDRSYRAGRFVRRHRVALGAAFLVAASLVGGTLVALHEARRADRRFEDVRRLAGSFLFEVHDAIRDLPGATPARRLVVRKAREYLDRLASETRGDTGLLEELAVAYQRVGDVQGYPGNANLGDAAGAAASYARARALAEELVAAHQDELRFRATLGRVLERQGTLQAALGEVGAARATLERSRALLAELHRIRGDDRHVAHDLHTTHLRLGDLLKTRTDPEEAAEHYAAAQRLAVEVLAVDPRDAEARRDLGVVLSRLADLWGSRNPARGLELHQRLLEIAIEDLAAEPDSARLRRDLSVGYEDVAQMHAALGHWSAALDHQHKSLALREELARADAANEQAQQDVSVTHAMIGDVLQSMNRPREALESYHRSLAIDERVASHNPQDQRGQDFLGSSHINVAEALVRLGRVSEALDHFRRGLAILDELSDADRANTGLRTYVAQVWERYGEVEGGKGKVACAAFARSASLWTDLAARSAVGEEEAASRAAVQTRLAKCPPAPASATIPPPTPPRSVPPPV